jgi:hypothetical protein
MDSINGYSERVGSDERGLKSAISGRWGRVLVKVGN